MASKRRNMFQKNKTQETMENEQLDINEIYGDLSSTDDCSAFGSDFRNLSDSDDKPRMTLEGSGRSGARRMDAVCSTDGLSSIKVPRKTPKRGKQFVCDECDYRAKYLSNFKRHKTIHSGEKPFACDQCDHRASLLSNLKKHKRLHTGDKPFLCDQCDYRATCLSHLKQHKTVHSGDKPFLCDQCDYRTNLVSNLKQHQRVHSGDKPFLCDHCDYRATNLSHLKRHRMIHSGEKPYNCDQCDYRTNRTMALKRHKAGHSGERAFACDLCDFAAARRSELRAHERTHSEGRAFACHRCDYRAANPCRLKQHAVVHRPERPFPCDRCDYRANQVSQLKKHKGRRHGGAHPTRSVHSTNFEETETGGNLKVQGRANMEGAAKLPSPSSGNFCRACKEVCGLEFPQRIADGNPLDEVSPTKLMGNPNVEPAHVAKLMQMVFDTRLGYFKDICDLSVLCCPARVRKPYERQGLRNDSIALDLSSSPPAARGLLYLAETTEDFRTGLLLYLNTDPFLPPVSTGRLPPGQGKRTPFVIGYLITESLSTLAVRSVLDDSLEVSMPECLQTI
ncbi:hypothetical protein AAG570_007241 [Ranatra chinensis]|uniref:C2H2-type domain-containing protein n=1 Tax=Ranatra chinensis TaxID=642074 RepID=A0ABD0XXZ9_9HEMI